MGGDDASADESAAIIAQQKAQLALLRSQVAELELSLAQHKDGAPPVSNAPPQPPLEHVDFHSFRGNIGPQGLGWQRPADQIPLR